MGSQLLHDEEPGGKPQSAKQQGVCTASFINQHRLDSARPRRLLNKHEDTNVGEVGQARALTQSLSSSCKKR